MKENDIKEIKYKVSTRYAANTLNGLGIDFTTRPEISLLIADAYMDGYSRCYSDLADKKKATIQDKEKMEKDIANEYLAIAYNAIAQIVLNWSVNPENNRKYTDIMSLLHNDSELPF